MEKWNELKIKFQRRGMGERNSMKRKQIGMNFSAIYTHTAILGFYYRCRSQLHFQSFPILHALPFPIILDIIGSDVCLCNFLWSFSAMAKATVCAVTLSSVWKNFIAPTSKPMIATVGFYQLHIYIQALCTIFSFIASNDKEDKKI